MRTHAEDFLAKLRERRAEIDQIAARRKASNIRVFGSVAKGTSAEQSDVDLLVTMGSDATLIDLIGLEQDLEALLGQRVDVVTDDALHPRMEKSVRRSAISL